MRGIEELKNIKDKRVIVRVDFNVPIKNGKIENDFKIRKAIPTIKFLLKKEAKVILITHLGREGNSVLPIYKSLSRFVKVKFVKGVVGKIVENKILSIKSGEAVLLENLRKNRGEKYCKKSFASLLSKLGDIYVNEAFAVSHRKDASIVLLPKMIPSYAGFQLKEEVSKLTLILKPKRPFFLIVGGVKFETKLPLIKRYLTLADKIFIGGGLANTFLFAKGYEIGKSVADRKYKIPKTIINSKKIILPTRVVVDRGNKRLDVKISEVKKEDYIVDVSQKSIDNLKPLIDKAKLILWNGPIGWDDRRATKGTNKLLRMLTRAKSNKTKVIVGGGDTVMAVQRLKLEKKFTFVSTGGGATLNFLVRGTLPGIKALD